MRQESVVRDGPQMTSVTTEVIEITENMSTEWIRDSDLLEQQDRIQ